MYCTLCYRRPHRWSGSGGRGGGICGDDDGIGNGSGSSEANSHGSSDGRVGRGKERKHGSGNSYHWNQGSGGRSSGNTCFPGQLSGNFSAKGSSSIGAFRVVDRQISSGYSGSAGSGTLIRGTKSEPATLLGSNSIISN